ncbi:hypothetical protein [Sulfurimonas sp.]|uniref:hypothetical protein n=1 Tax=Sulfurimonas sp. TaxID=2022749 RepID=UPI002602F0FC|nr:hypothetical protein [Sulfurimonas sp.]MDD5157781.1 hypothetical protein [Sulfurimonas sp.]
MFRLISLLIISISLFAQTITLSDLVFIVQKKDKINIIFSNDVPKTLLVDLPSDYNKSTYLPYLKSLLYANGFKISNDDGIYIISNSNSSIKDSFLNQNQPGESTSDNNSFIQRKSQSFNQNYNQPYQSNEQRIDPITGRPIIFNSTNPQQPDLKNDLNISFSTQKLDYLQFENIKSFLDFSTVPYVYSNISKTIIFKQTSKNVCLIDKIKEQIEFLDIKKEQVTLKITIFSTNKEKLKEVGLNSSINFDFSLLSKSGALLTGEAVAGFKGSLKALSIQGALDIIQSTSYLISDNDKLDYKKVVSIPFLDENFVLTTDNGTNQSKKYKYKDIGFKVLATPNIVGETINLDFALNYGEILSSGDYPITSDNSIINKFSVKKGDILLLSGLTKDSINDKNEALPFFEDIPFIRDIFTHKTKSDKKEIFNISIEIQ